MYAPRDTQRYANAQLPPARDKYKAGSGASGNAMDTPPARDDQSDTAGPSPQLENVDYPRAAPPTTPLTSTEERDALTSSTLAETSTTTAPAPLSSTSSDMSGNRASLAARRRSVLETALKNAAVHPHSRCSALPATGGGAASEATVAACVSSAPAAMAVNRVGAMPLTAVRSPIQTQAVADKVRNEPSSGAGMGYHGHQMVRGVNIGGFLVPEFWITPSLIASIPDPKPNDYLELCQRLGADATRTLMRRHWDTWVTEAEIQRLAGAGLTHLRVPVGHWEFVDSGEGYVSGGLPYFKRLAYWAYKHGLKVIPDMHTAPGSQNGFDNSGSTSGVNWTKNPNNVALSKRALIEMLRFLASDPVMLATVDAIDLLNEPFIDALEFDQLWDYDTGGHTLVRERLPKVPPVVSIIDRGFQEFRWWQTRWPRDWNAKYSDAWLDAHIYHVFDRNIDDWPLERHLQLVCQHGHDLKTNATFFPTIVGEWSLALPKAALKRGRENEARRRFAEAQLDAYELGGAGWIFWCFKTEESPEWSFLDSLDRSWLPQPLTNREFPPPCATRL